MGLWRYVIAEEIRGCSRLRRPRSSVFSARSRRRRYSIRQTWTKLPAFVRVIPRRRRASDAREVQPGEQRLPGGAQSPVRDRATIQRMVSGLRCRISPRRCCSPAVFPRSWTPFGSCRKGQLRDCGRSRCAAPCRSIREPKISFAPSLKSVSDSPLIQRCRSRNGSGSIRRSRCWPMRRATASSPRCCARSPPRKSRSRATASTRSRSNARALNPEYPGEYCFPPLASLITAAARLMLALLERCVTDLGGTYAMEDTDSMAIVANAARRPNRMPGGPDRRRRKPAIQGAIVGTGGCDC